MNTPLPPELEALARDLTTNLFATPARRRAMRDELLSHLLSAYEEELSRHPHTSPSDAIQSTLHRLGHPAALRQQLQSSVPLPERLFFQLVSQKENAMPRLLWFLACLALLLGTTMILPALGRHYNNHQSWDIVAYPLAIGILIALAGLSTLAYGTVRRLTRRAAV